MAQDQTVDALADRGEQFIIPNVHRAQNGPVTACRANLVTNRDMDSKVPHPI
jgi:hypothetical protein